MVSADRLASPSEFVTGFDSCLSQVADLDCPGIVRGGVKQRVYLLEVGSDGLPEHVEFVVCRIRDRFAAVVVISRRSGVDQRPESAQVVWKHETRYRVAPCGKLFNDREQGFQTLDVVLGPGWC